MSTILHPDGHMRCFWPGTDPLYVAYHDVDWGVPEIDGRALFEKLVLDGFQAGLSWITILRKRENFRSAFDGFEPQRMARYTDRKIASLMADAGIVRNRAKIEGAVKSACAYLDLAGKQDFSAFIWDFVDGEPVQNKWRDRSEIPAETDISRRLSKALADKGFKFCGPTIVYAFMQAVGMVNDHFVDCWRHDAIGADCHATRRRQ
ncbi:MAG: DNA-3-methyladenine glycosylase I [Polyangiaceae bacterium]|nr:DNA-3-methyladenine glycosylase I [Polyangiaceae bacterium]